MMGRVPADSRVFLDSMAEDARGFDWSSAKLSECAEDNLLAIHPIICAELSIRFEQIEESKSPLPAPGSTINAIEGRHVTHRAGGR
jgi:hypothetical protein